MMIESPTKVIGCSIDDINVTVENTDDWILVPTNITSEITEIYATETVTSMSTNRVIPTTTRPHSTTAKLTVSEKHNTDILPWTYQCGNHPQRDYTKLTLLQRDKFCDFEKGQQMNKTPKLLTQC